MHPKRPQQSQPNESAAMLEVVAEAIFGLVLGGLVAVVIVGTYSISIFV
jgi:hypothetical protein